MSRRFQTVWNSGIGALKFARATRSRRFLVGTSFTTATFAASGLMRKTVSCQDNQNNDKLNTKTDDTTNQISNLVGPIVGQLGFGGVMGFATGYAFKKAAKITVMIVGGSFVILQGLSYSGVIQLDWKSIEKGVHQTLDRTGDGKVDQSDLSTMVQKVMSVLQYGFVASGSFGVGLILGLKKG